MSFSIHVKDEISRIEIRSLCCMYAELQGIIDVYEYASHATTRKNKNTVVTESSSFARRLFALIKETFHQTPRILIRKSKKLKGRTSYVISWKFKDEDNHESIDSSNLIFHLSPSTNLCCKKAYLRGSFLAGGSIANPEKSYHLELICHNTKIANKIMNLMEGYELHPKIIDRNIGVVVYLKEGENIVDFLNIIGAHHALMQLENVRILKDMRNKVNRVVNCETANLEKTVQASVRQIENIKFIRDHFGLDNLPQNLREIAKIRLDHADANLQELGSLLEPCLGKSGVNHRMRKLDEIANQLKKRGDEK